MTTDASAAAAEGDGARRPAPLTLAWVEWLGSALSSCEVDTDADIVLAHSATESDGSQFRWHVRIRGGAVKVAAGPPEEADESRTVTFASSRETAWAVAVEGRSAQREVLEGRMKVSGDVRLLLKSRQAIEQISVALSKQPPARSGRDQQEAGRPFGAT